MTSIEVNLTMLKERQNLSLAWFADRLYDELCACKSESVKQGPVNVRPDHKDILVFDSRKYHDQAHNYHHAIILALENKPVPYFLIRR